MHFIYFELRKGIGLFELNEDRAYLLCESYTFSYVCERRFTEEFALLNFFLPSKLRAFMIGLRFRNYSLLL